MERERKRQLGRKRQRDRDRERQRQRNTEKERYKQTDRQRERVSEREREREKERAREEFFDPAFTCMVIKSFDVNKFSDYDISQPIKFGYVHRTLRIIISSCMAKSSY